MAGTVTREQLDRMIGQRLGVSDWFAIDQERVNRFADVTLDHQFIHVDPERAKQTPFGGTIAHGFLTLSLLVPLCIAFIPEPEDRTLLVNYGFDKSASSRPCASASASARSARSRRSRSASRATSHEDRRDRRDRERRQARARRGMVEPACRRLTPRSSTFASATRAAARSHFRSWRSPRSSCSRAATATRRPSSARETRRPSPRRRRPRTAAPSRITPAMVEAANAIDGDDIRAVVAEIADDRYVGRAPGSPGDKMTRAYLEKELAKRGFEPGGEGGSWEQPVELVGVTAEPPAKWTFARGADRVALERDTDFVASSGVQAPKASVDGAEVVFVGYGIEAPEYDWDDFKGVDVTRQSAADAQQRPGLGSRAVRGQRAAVLRPLGIQIRERGAARSGRRDHHSHDAVRGLSVAHRAGELGRPAVQAAGRRRAARADRGMDHRGRRAPAARTRT